VARAAPGPAFASSTARCRPGSLAACNEGGGRKVDRWIARAQGAEVLFDDAEAFVDDNMPGEPQRPAAPARTSSRHRRPLRSTAPSAAARGARRCRPE